VPVRQTVSAAKAALFNQFGRGVVHMDFVLSAPVPPVQEGEFMRNILSTVSPGGSAHSLAALGVAITASGTWPVANRAIFQPFTLLERVVVRNLFIANGIAAAGNFDLGIYDALLERIVSTGPTAQAGTSILQFVNIVSTPLEPGEYFWAAAFDNAPSTVAQFVQAAASIQLLSAGFLASSYPLPVRITGTFSGSLVLPVQGMGFDRLLG